MYKSLALASSTKAAYKTHLMTFLRFCFYYEICPVPIDQNSLACYVAHLARTLSPSSVGIYLNIVRIMHLETGLANPLAENFEVAMIKRGINRVKKARRRNRKIR